LTATDQVSGRCKAAARGREKFALSSDFVMAGLVPSIHVLQSGCMLGGWVYIVTNKPNGILYTGVTRNIARRAWEHRQGVITGFTLRYGLKRLVWCEHHNTILGAIQREKNIKHWPRAWKVRLIIGINSQVYG
jgi:putative endonuclease